MGYNRTQWTGLILGLGLFILVLAVPSIPSPGGGAPLAGPAKRALAASLLIAVWWITTPIPLAATSLLPMVLFPALGIATLDSVSQQYSNSKVYLYLGGFMLALGIERWGLHRRLALWVMILVGGGPRRLVLGAMLATAGLSMWISNTATTLMMLPLALAIVKVLGELDPTLSSPSLGTDEDDFSHQPGQKLAVPMLLGIAYAASIGGISTPIGTPPNVILRGLMEKSADLPEIGWGPWIALFLPVSLVFLLIAWFVLAWRLPKAIHTADGAPSGSSQAFLKSQLRQLGDMTPAERWMLFFFVITAGLWITRPWWLDAWASLADVWGWQGVSDSAKKYLDDTSVALTVGTLLFFIPVKQTPPDASGKPPTHPDNRRTDAPPTSASWNRLMDWDTARKLPWGILLLFGGGFALATAFSSSGLSEWIGEQFQAFSDLPPLALVACVCFLMTFLTEMTSNVATTNVMLPILHSAAGPMNVSALMLMVPATISASFAFMLPVATPPNAIVFGSRRLTVGQMARYGIILNLIGIGLVTALMAVWMLLDPQLASP